MADPAPPQTAIDEHVRRRGWSHAPAVAGYGLLTLWVLWPAVAHFRTRAMANAVDAAMFTWLWDVMPTALMEGANPYRTDLVFHPVGTDLAMTTSAPLLALTTWPVRAALGPEAQINVLQLVAMFTAGIATYLLAHRVCGHRGAAFVAGVGYALLPARFVHMEGSLNLIFTGVLPAGILVFLWFVDAPSWRRAVALGGACGSVFLIDPQLALLLALGLGVLAIVHRRKMPGAVPELIGSLVVAVVVAAPLMVPMALAMAQGKVAEAPSTASTIRDSSSPLSWVVPPLERLWMGQYLPSVDRMTAAWEGVAYTGLALLALAIAAPALVDVGRRRGWVAVALVGFVLSLGPYLFVRNTSLDVPLPFFAVRLVPGLDAMRVPARFGLLGAVAVVVLAALSLAHLARRIPRRAGLVIFAVGVLTVVELYPRTLPHRDDRIPAAYEVLARDKTDGAVLEVPLKWSTTQVHYGFEGQDADFRFLLYQLEHGHPIVSGAVSRYPDDDLDRLVREPVYRQVLALANQPGFDDRARFGPSDLADLGIGFVAYHRDDPVPAALRYLRTLDMEVLADDGTVIIWRVDP